MATELAMAIRRLKAQEALAKEVAELNRKMDLVMDHLGIGTTAPVEEIPADGAESTSTEEVLPDGDEKTETEEVVDANPKDQ